MLQANIPAASSCDHVIAVYANVIFSPHLEQVSQCIEVSVYDFHKEDRRLNCHSRSLALLFFLNFSRMFQVIFLKEIPLFHK